MRLVECTREQHGEAILRLLNEAIVNSTALYEYRPRSLASMDAWFDSKAEGNYPVLGMQDESGALLGFASYGIFRPHPAYKYTVEHSVYVDAAVRRKGIAAALMRALIDTARGQDYHVMVGGIDAGNGASIGLHEKLGFIHVGTLRHAGFKFGRWLDLAFYQLILDTPVTPVAS